MYSEIELTINRLGEERSEGQQINDLRPAGRREDKEGRTDASNSELMGGHHSFSIICMHISLLQTAYFSDIAGVLFNVEYSLEHKISFGY